eukprot:sb/3464856/
MIRRGSHDLTNFKNHDTVTLVVVQFNYSREKERDREGEREGESRLSGTNISFNKSTHWSEPLNLRSFFCRGRFMISSFLSHSKHPIRSRYLGHVTGYQPISCKAEKRGSKVCSVLALVGVDTHEKSLSHLTISLKIQEKGRGPKTQLSHRGFFVIFFGDSRDPLGPIGEGISLGVARHEMLNTMIFLRNLSEFNLIVSEFLPPHFDPANLNIDGHRTVHLRPFRSLYFDPFSTSNKLFLQEIDDSPDLTPRLSFAFTQSSTLVTSSHRVDLIGEDGSGTTKPGEKERGTTTVGQIIEVDEVNRVVVKVGRRPVGDPGLITVDIRSEHMTEHIPMTVFTPASPPSPHILLNSLSLHLYSLDISLFDEEEVLVMSARVQDLRGSYSGEGEGGVRMEVGVGGAQIDNCLRDQHYDYRNRPNQELLVPGWLITSHVT